MKYRKKPVVVEAMQYTGDNAQEIADSMERQQAMIKDGYLLVGAREGTMKASVMDWIIKGIKGEFCPCKPDIFEKTYEPVE